MEELSEITQEVARLKSKVNSQIDSVERMVKLVSMYKEIDPEWMKGCLHVFLTQNEKEG